MLCFEQTIPLFTPQFAVSSLEQQTATSANDREKLTSPFEMMTGVITPLSPLRSSYDFDRFLREWVLNVALHFMAISL